MTTLYRALTLGILAGIAAFMGVCDTDTGKLAHAAGDPTLAEQVGIAVFWLWLLLSLLVWDIRDTVQKNRDDS